MSKSRTVKKQYHKCPICQSHDIMYGDYDFGAEVCIEVECGNCGLMWSEIFEFAFSEFWEEE